MDNLKKTVWTWGAAAAMALLASGCGKKTCFFTTQNPGDVKSGAPAVWYGAFVGKVSKVVPEKETTRVEISFYGKYDNAIHDGVTAHVAVDPGISPHPFVLMVDGKDKTRPTLGDGVQIPETRPDHAMKEKAMTFFRWFKTTRATKLAIALAVLVVLVVLASRLPKALGLAGLVVAVVFIVYMAVNMRAGWNDYKKTNGNETVLPARSGK